MPTSLLTLEGSRVQLHSENCHDTQAIHSLAHHDQVLPTIPGYELLEELGRGGMGVVYKARDIKLKRFVAIKMLLDPEFASAEQRLRFKIEAEAVAQLQHPNIVQVYELGEQPGSKGGIPHPYMVLEYIDGLTLFRTMRQHPFTEREAATLVVTLARAIQHAHDHGLIHRDLKPANVLISRESATDEIDQQSSSTAQDLSTGTFTPKITDFGLVKTLVANGEAGRNLTRTELIVGTPQYMAPEQANRQPQALSSTVDVYSLGVILYELLTGRLPFEDGDIMKMLMEMQTEEPPSPRSIKPKLSLDLETITLKCLEKEPQRRYPSAAALADDLTRYLNHEPIQARPLSEWQRVAKWIRRHPAIASLATLLMGVVWIALVVIVALWRQADADRAGAVEQSFNASLSRDAARHSEHVAREAEATARLSEHQAQTSLYFSKIAQSDLLLRQGQVARPRMLLQECGRSNSLSEIRGWEWLHLLRLCKPMEHVLDASHDYVQRLAFHPQQQMIFSIEGAEYYGDKAADSFPGRLFVHRHNSISGKWESNVGYVAKLPLRDLKLALGGRKVIVTNIHDDIFVLDTEAILHGKEAIKAGPVVREAKWKVAADAGLIATWRKEKTSPQIDLYDLSLQKISRSIRLSSEVVEVCISDQGELLFYQLKNGTLGMWDVRREKVLWEQPRPPSGEYRITLSGNAQQAAYCTFPQGDLVWMEASTAKVLFKMHDVRCDGPQLAADGDRLAGSCLTTADHDVMVWQRSPDGKVAHIPLVLRGHHGFVRGYELDRTGNRMLTYGIDGVVRLWDTSLGSSHTGACLQAYRGHLGSVLCAAFDPRNELIATGGIDANIMIWNARHSVDNDLYSVGDGFSGEWISAYSFVEGTSQLAIFEQKSAQMRLLNMETRKFQDKFTLSEAFNGFRAPRYDCSFSRDGKRFAVLDKGMQRGLIYETLTGRLLWSTPKADFRILQTHLSADGKRLLIAGHYLQPGTERKLVPYQCSYQVWDLEKKEMVHQAQLNRFLQGCAINNDGSRIVAALQKPSKERELAMFLVGEKGRELFTEPFSLTRCMALCFSPDGKYFAGCNFDPEQNWLTLRDAQTGKEIHRMQSVFESTTVAFTPDSRRVLVTGYDSHVVMFDTATGHEVVTLKHHGLPRQNDYALSPKIVFSQDSTKLAVNSWDAAITIWHAYSPEKKDVLLELPDDHANRYQTGESPPAFQR